VCLGFRDGPARKAGRGELLTAKVAKKGREGREEVQRQEQKRADTGVRPHKQPKVKSEDKATSCTNHNGY